jgi:hypothetical protein
MALEVYLMTIRTNPNAPYKWREDAMLDNAERLHRINNDLRVGLVFGAIIIILLIIIACKESK